MKIPNLFNAGILMSADPTTKILKIYSKYNSDKLLFNEYIDIDDQDEWIKYSYKIIDAIRDAEKMAVRATTNTLTDITQNNLTDFKIKYGDYKDG